jgi:sn-glycerol 3-phosphate transport system substrate-binding protein
MTMIKRIFNRTLAGFAASLTLLGTAVAQVEVPFYFPVAVGGPITKLIDQYAADFNKENPSIKVQPIYAGSYQDTIVKALTAQKAGTPPVASVLLSTDTFTLIDEDAVVPIDNFIKTAEDRAWLAGFYKAFLLNSQVGGKTWGVPFQRSTIVLYWNKEMFKEAGLDPNKPPTNWSELVAMASKLTKKDASGKVTQFGIQVPSSGFPYWLFQGFTTQNDVVLANEAGNQVRFDDPKVIEALQFWVDLSRKHGVHPTGVVEWGTTPKDFMEKKAAMIWTTTGNLTNIRTNAKFDFGVAMLPSGKKRGSPTGGGNFFIFKKASPAQQEAAFKFARWLTTPDRAAQWGIDTGYVAVSPAAWDTAAMKKYAAEFAPATVARDQLAHAVAELSTHDNQRVTKALNDGLQAALNGTKTPEQAMKDAQREAERLLRSYK